MSVSAGALGPAYVRVTACASPTRGAGTEGRNAQESRASIVSCSGLYWLLVLSREGRVGDR